MAETRCVIFDLDGVLADSEILSAEALRLELAEVGVEVTAEAFMRDFLGRSFPTVAEALRRRTDALPADFETRYRARLMATFQTRLRRTPGLDRVLDRLAVPARVATSSTPLRAGRTLQILGLWERFGERLDTASEVARGKPAPDLFLLSARRAGFAPECCLVIEDSAPGLAAAAAAGMPSIHYRGGQHHAGTTWDGPAPSVGTLEHWGALEDMVPGLLEDAP